MPSKHHGGGPQSTSSGTNNTYSAKNPLLGNNGSAISGNNGQVMITGNPSTLKMHMTGMESFNVTSKRGGAGGSIPMSQTTGTSQGGPGSAMTGADSQS